MTTWVISIDKDHPQHWDYAKKHKVWDLRTRQNIARGDTIYFWQAKQGIVGRGLVAREVRDSPTTGLPWDDSGTTTYRGRIDFAWLQDLGSDHLSWSEIQENTGITGLLHQFPRTSDSAVEARLAEFLAASRTEPVDLPSSLDAAVEALAAPPADVTTASPDELTEDHRRRTLAEIRLRQGQPAFRNALIKAYGRQCAVTGSGAVEVLEAAHIMPYKGHHTNVVKNGILLRSDIHTLFDRMLLTVVPDSRGGFVTRVDPGVTDDLYASLDGAPLSSVPVRAADQPAPDLLMRHASQCTWFG